jgi:predicted anti-sigma-YlaC factor YlaD
VRESLSASGDGELPPLPARQVDTHLRGCDSCRRWAKAMHEIDRRVRVGGDLPDPHLTAVLLGAIEADARYRRSRRQWAVVVILVTLSGLAQLVMSVPLLAAHGKVWRGAPVVALESVVAVSFLAGALSLLWHYRNSVEPLEVARESQAARSATNDEAGEVA